MGIEAFRIELPEHNTYGEVMKGYFSLMRGFGIEFARRSDRLLIPTYGPAWFDDYVERRRAEDPQRAKRRQSPEDPSFFLGEYLRVPETIYREVIPNSGDLRVISKKIVDMRNTWLHFSDEPSAAQLREAADLVRGFGQKVSMGIQGPAAQMMKRIDRIRSGQYQAATPEPQTAAQPQPASNDGDEPPAEVELETVERPSRPPIGGLWRGDIPERRVRVTRTRDVVDVQTGRSLRSEVDGDFSEKLRQWTSAKPMGELWVDADGAVGGFIDGQERLLGYTGPNPAGDIARGFLVRRYYDILDGKIVDLDSGETLTELVPEGAASEAMAIQNAVVSQVEPGGTIRITNYGDVLYIDDQGMTRLAVATPSTWFPGHLG